MGKHRELASLVFLNTAIAIYTMMNRYIGNASGIFIVFCIFLVLAWFRVGRSVSIPRLLVLFSVLISILILLFSVFVLKVPAGIALTLFISGLILVKSFSVSKLHDYAQLMVLSVMAIIAGGALKITAEYIFALSIYMVLGGYCVYKMHLIKEYLLHRNLHDTSSAIVTVAGVKPGFGSYIPVLITTGVIAFIIFTLVPRESPAWLMSGMKNKSGPTITGFSQKLILGEMNVLLKDKTPVIRVKLTRLKGKKSSYQGILYLRGDVYSRYEFVNNSWRWLAVHPEKYNRQIISNFEAVAIKKSELPEEKLYKWDVFYQKPVSTNLFVLGMPIAIATSRQMNLTYNFYSNVILYSSYPEQGFHYTLWSEPFSYVNIKPVPLGKRMVKHYVNDIEADIKVRNVKQKNNMPHARFDVIDVPQVRVVDENRFKRFLRKIPSFYENGKQHETLSPEAKAQKIAIYLKTNFHYSLDNSDVSEDVEPVWDFLVRRKKGHCEYFASAMVLLARAAGLNARIVAGFKGGKYNDIGKYYVIRNCDAHTWVEVYIPGKGWRRYDPTPADRESFLFGEESFLAKPFWDFIDLIKFSWIEKLSALKRTKKIVTKVQKRLLSSEKNGHYEAIKRFLGKIIHYIKDQKYGSVWFQLLHWIVGILLVALAILLIRIFWEVVQILNRAIHDIFEQRWQKKFGSAWHCPVDFYRKLLLWMIPKGLARRPNETAGEYADRIIARYPQISRQMNVLTDKYLCFRFGKREIDKNESKELLEICCEIQKTIKAYEKNKS